MRSHRTAQGVMEQISRTRESCGDDSDISNSATVASGSHVYRKICSRVLLTVFTMTRSLDSDGVCQVCNDVCASRPAMLSSVVFLCRASPRRHPSIKMRNSRTHFSCDSAVLADHSWRWTCSRGGTKSVADST